VNRLGLLITVMMALTAVYFLVTNVFAPPKPQVVVVKPSGAQNTSPSVNPSANQPVAQPGEPAPVGGIYACVKAVFLKVGGVTLCADTLYSVVRGDGVIQIDFQDGMVQGNFMFVSAPMCAVVTTPQGALLVPCRAVIQITANK
jgi:monoamine oxidase